MLKSLYHLLHKYKYTHVYPICICTPLHIYKNRCHYKYIDIRNNIYNNSYDFKSISYGFFDYYEYYIQMNTKKGVRKHLCWGITCSPVRFIVNPETILNKTTFFEKNSTLYDKDKDIFITI